MTSFLSDLYIPAVLMSVITAAGLMTSKVHVLLNLNVEKFLRNYSEGTHYTVTSRPSSTVLIQSEALLNGWGLY